MLKSLVAHGVDVLVQDKDGRQPLMWAASSGTFCLYFPSLCDGVSYIPPAPRFSGSSDAILSLVHGKAAVDATDKDGLTALHCAASRGHRECAETLATLCGAHPNCVDANGCTPLFYAVTLGHADCVGLLLQLGANCDQQDRKGRR